MEVSKLPDVRPTYTSEKYSPTAGSKVEALLLASWPRMLIRVNPVPRGSAAICRPGAVAARLVIS